MQEIKRLDNEIGKVRQLVGVTKEFQDWKLLVSDVDRLKGEHVPREVFESKLRELSTKIEAYEKIEEAYERLSTQQEKVLEQQSSFLKWIKYSTILVPIAVAVIPVIEYLLRYLLKVP
jgi:predicted transcriptional regulator